MTFQQVPTLPHSFQAKELRHHQISRQENVLSKGDTITTGGLEFFGNKYFCGDKWASEEINNSSPPPPFPQICSGGPLFETFVFSLLSAHGVFTGCSQGGKVTFGNTLCTFNMLRRGGRAALQLPRTTMGRSFGELLERYSPSNPITFKVSTHTCE